MARRRVAVHSNLNLKSARPAGGPSENSSSLLDRDLGSTGPSAADFIMIFSTSDCAQAHAGDRGRGRGPGPGPLQIYIYADYAVEAPIID